MADEIRQYDLPPAGDISDTDTLTGTKGSNIGDDRKFSWGLIKTKLREIFSTVQNAVISGGTILVESSNVLVADVTYRIDGYIFNALAVVEPVVNSASGMQRFVAFFGTTDSQIIKVEGVEGVTATMPVQPEHTVLIGYVLVSDGGIGVPQVDYSQYVTNSYLSTIIDTISGVFKGKITTASLTSNRTHTLQNKDGILAHLSDIMGGRIAVDVNNPTQNALYIEPDISGRRVFYGSPSVSVATVNFNYAGGVEGVRGLGMIVGFYIFWGGSSFGLTRTAANDMQYNSGNNTNSEANGRHLFYVSDGLGGFNSNLLVAAINRKGLIAKSFNLQALNTAPSSATDTGTVGEIRYTSEYIYVCVGTNTWKRTPLTTW